MSIVFDLLAALGIIALGSAIAILPIHWAAGVYERRRPPVVPRARREYLERL